MKYFWVCCEACNDQWVAPFLSEFGFLVPTESHGEECPDCGGSLEIQDEWEGSDE